MAYFYTYIDPAEIEAQFKKKEGDDDEEDTKDKTRKLEGEMGRRGSVSSGDEEDQKSKQTSF